MDNLIYFYADQNGQVYQPVNPIIDGELPEGCIALTAAEVKKIEDDLAANQPTIVNTQEEIQAEFTRAIQRRLDEFARTRGYDGILSACTYASSTIDKFKIEGQYCVDIRDATWANAYQIIDIVKTTGVMPTLDDVIAQLPALDWPA